MPKAFHQFAALPWRDTAHGIEVLLITSRETKRWVIPKGWPMAGMKPHLAAAREAYEEAGVGGRVSSRSIGHYTYDKLSKNGDGRLVRAAVYPLEVLIRHPIWPEQGQREERWLSPAAAAELVREPGLKKLIMDFKSSMRK